MEKRVLLLLSMSLLILNAMAQKQVTFQKFTYTSKKDTLPYALLEPLSVTAGKKYPLVIFLHGKGERGKDNEQHLKHIRILYNRNVLDKYPGYVLAPQCPETGVWSEMMLGKPFGNPTKPMQLFIQLLDKIMKEYPIDPSKVYVTGVSMGGYGTWDLIARFPNRFAAAVPICGGGDERIIEKIKHIPIWAFHGALDEIVPATQSRKMIAALQKAGAAPGYTEYPEVKHPSWNHAYKEPHLMPWLFRHSKK